MTTTSDGRHPLVMAAVDVHKHYPGIKALDGVNLELRAGEVHGLVGANGAGKSTLLKVLTGVVRPDHGQLLLDGHELHLHGPHDGRRFGIAAVHQEPALIPALDAVSNMYLGRQVTAFGFRRRRAMANGFELSRERLHLDLMPRAVTGGLSLSVQQQVEILRALHTEARVLVLDEPTAALGQRERAQLLEIVDTVRRAGSAVLFISHHLEEVLELCDTITVLRNGQVAADGPARSFTMEQLTSAMIGRTIDVLQRRRPPLPDAPNVAAALEVDGLRTASGLKIDHLSVQPGEVVGLAGLVGSGRSRLLRALAGLEQPVEGRLRIAGSDVVWPRSPRQAAAHGIGLAPEDRRIEGLNLRQSSWINITVNTLARPQRFTFVRRRLAEKLAREQAQVVGLGADKLRAPVGTLSGGNQQKVVLARLLYQRPTLLLVDEPMRGIDVGAKEEIFGTIEATAQAGSSALVASEETEDLLAICDRVIVLRHGRVAAVVAGLSQRDAAYAAMLGTSSPAHERRAS